jgi:hypothetical protein
MKHSRITNIPKSPLEIFLEAKNVSFNYHIDELGSKDNPSSSIRKRSKLTFEEAYELMNPYKPHWVIIYRDQEHITGGQEKSYWEFGGSNLSDNGYGIVYMFISVEIEKAEEIFKKYNLNINENPLIRIG